MGLCNSSTKKDIVHDRQRAAPVSQERRPQPTASQRQDSFLQPTSALSISQDPQNRFRDDGEADFDQYGQSYTNRRTQEYDILQNIVLSTQVNFIDVDQRPSSLDDEEQQSRMQQYAQKLTAGDLLDVGSVSHPRGGPSSGGVAQPRSDLLPAPTEAATDVSDRRLDMAALHGASLKQLVQLTHTPSWVGDQPDADGVQAAFAALRPTEGVPAQELAMLRSLSLHLRQALSSSFPQQNLKIIVSFEELESEIADAGDSPSDGSSESSEVVAH